ncbi:MAG TPA: hypothetical protein P5084_01025 [Paludibacter sp.]|nr:hypothetical protein [Paludibacter sp.]
MKSPEYEDLKNRIELLENEIAEMAELDDNELADRVYELEAEINCRIDSSISEKDFNAYEKLMRRIKKIIHEHDLFDEEVELEIMSSETEYSDFDPFSSSSDNVFEDDE